MKKIYHVIYILIFLLISNMGFAQLTIVDAVAVDGDGDGYYATIEIEFSAPVNDSEFELSAITQDEWDFSEFSNFSTVILANNFYTDVNVIAGDSIENDRYVRITTQSQFSSSNGYIYFRYTNDNPTIDSISAFYSPADIIADFTTDSASDNSPPAIATPSYAETSLFGVGEKIVLSFPFEGSETGITANNIIFNGETLSNDSLIEDGGGVYHLNYWVTEGANDVSDSDTIPFSITFSDIYGNTITYTNSPAAGSCPSIDANTPVISSVVFDPGDGTVLEDNDQTTIYVTMQGGEAGLTSPYFYVNGRNRESWSNDGSGNYSAVYKVDRALDPEIADPTERLPFKIVFSDGANETDTLTEADLSIDNTPGVSITKPVIDSVLFIPGQGDTLGIGDTLTVVLYAAGETGLTGSQLEINNIVLYNESLYDSLNGNYSCQYIVKEGDTDVADNEEIIIDFKLTDGTKISDLFDNGDIVADDCPAIDANNPDITSVVFSTGDGNTVGIGTSINIDVNASDNTGLSVNQFLVNNVDVSGTFVEGGTENYRAVYTVSEGDNDIDDATRLPISIILSDGRNLSVEYTQNDLPSDNTPGVDANRPGVKSVTFSPGHGNTLGIDSILTVTLEADNSESGLSAASMTVNGVDVSGSYAPEGTPGFYTLEYKVLNGHGSIMDGTQAIPVSFVFNDGYNSTLPAFTSSTILSTPGIDDTAPGALSVSLLPNTGTVAIGDTIVITIAAGEDGLEANTISFNNKDLKNKFEATGGGSKQYTVEYVVKQGDNEVDDASGIPVSIILNDEAGNTTPEFNSLAAGNCPGIDSSLPKIESVVLKNKSKIIGDEDTLHITITADSEFNNYTFVSGTVAGYTIKAIDPVNSTTIYALFDITSRTYDIDSAETVLVSNLQLSDGTNLSNIISTSVANDNHAIFSKKPTAQISGSETLCDKDSIEVPIVLNGYAPFNITYTDGFTPVVINDITTNPYMLKIIADESIGDPLTYTITNITDATGNTNSGSGSFILDINSLPDVKFITPPLNKTYNINAEADTLVGDPLGGVFSGNGIVSSNNTFLASSAGINTHKISYTYTIPSTGCWSSDTLEFEVIESNADINFDNGDDDWRCDYESTMGITAEVVDKSIIGDIKLYSNPSAITDHGDNTATIDISQLSEGTYQITFEYVDGTAVSVNKSFTVESVSTSIDITDIDNQCEDYDTINVAAFNLTPVGGTGEYFFTGSSGDFNVYDPDGNQMYFYPDSVDPGSYQLKYVYTTPNGCVGDTVRKYFDVNALPSVGISMNSVYNIDQGESTITGTPTDARGEFYPAFMNDNNDGTALFDPADAGLGTYWVKYIYEDSKGCVNADSTEIEVNQALGEITSSSGSFQFCYFGSSAVTLTGAPDPTDGSPGSFYIDGVLITPVSDNVISFNPQDYTAGEHKVRFEYSVGGTDYQVFETLDIDSIGTTYYTGLEDAYCESEDIEVELTAFYAGLDGSMAFSGNGTTDNVDDNLGYFNPSEANLGDNIITYTFTRDYSGCQKSYDKNVTVNKTPTVAFYPDEKCIVGTNDPLSFTADTLASDSIVSWDWTFRTINKSFNRSPSFNPIPGYNSMRLKLTTNDGCSNEVDSVFYIGTRVDLKFSFENECHGEVVLFELINTSDPQDTISTGWDFGGSGVADYSDKEKPTFRYDSPGAYDVIYEEILKSCGRIADTLKLNIRPSIDLSSGGYLESFEDEPNVTGWVIEDTDEEETNTWQWGEPAGDKINTAASGANLFATNLSGNYANDENGVITSPCFDFSQVQRPMLKMNFISYTETDRDGVVMQYTKPNGDWTTIGVPADGISWYNSYIISGSPANQQLGWTGEIIDSENNGWNTAMFRLDELRGRAGVRFRIVFGSNGDFTDEGFAFDNVEFKERERLVLLENFTNIYDEDANQSQDRYINPILQKDSLDLISLNYHTSFPNSNGLNSYYPSGPSARSLYYGVSAVPFSVVDGKRQFDYSPGNELLESDIHKRVLIDESFSIGLKQDVQNNKLVISASVKALKDISNRDLVAYIAVVENTVEFDSEIYHNVLRTMLPDAAGYLIERDWLSNDSVQIYQTWSIPDDINVDSLLTIVFVQDEETKEVYQTSYTNKFSTITSIEDINESFVSYDFRVYPNPVKNMLTLEILKNVNNDMQVKMYNGVGAMVKSGVIERGIKRLEFNTSDLPAGVYYIRIISADKLIETRKIIKVE